MAFDFRFPDVGEGLHEGTLVEWLVKEGDEVALDEPFARVETDKAIVELPAPKKARVTKLHFKAGDIMDVGAVMISFEDGSGSSVEVKSTPPSSSKQAPEPIAASPEQCNGGKRVMATPRTRALARKLAINISQVKGTGRGGRIEESDVLRFHEEGNPESATTAQSTTTEKNLTTKPASSGALVESKDGPIERVPLTHLRKVIARAMTESRSHAVPVTHVDEADVTDLLAIYGKAKKKVDGSVKFSLLPYFIKAIVNGLIHHPMLNATYDEEKQELIMKRYFHIGMAVDSAEGLVVPVIRDADRKDLLTIAAEISDLAERARDRTLRPEELRGASFTVSSIGPLGGAFATPIIQYPQLAIIGLHAIKDRAAVIDGEIVPRKMMYVSVSYDHRIIDGAVAARFMNQVIELMENPDLLMLKL